MLDFFISDSDFYLLILLSISIVIAIISIIRVIWFKVKHPGTHMKIKSYAIKNRGKILIVAIAMGILIAALPMLFFIEKENTLVSVDLQMINRSGINVEEVEGLQNGKLDKRDDYENKSYGTVFLKKYEDYSFCVTYNGSVWGNGDNGVYTPSYQYQVYDAKSKFISKKIIRELQKRIQKEETAEAKILVDTEDKFLCIYADGSQTKSVLIRKGKKVFNILYTGNGDIEAWANNYLS